MTVYSTKSFRQFFSRLLKFPIGAWSKTWTKPHGFWKDFAWISQSSKFETEKKYFSTSIEQKLASGAPTNYPIEDPSALLETSKGIFFLFQNLAVVKSNRSILLYTLKQLFCETEWPTCKKIALFGLFLYSKWVEKARI